MWCIRTDRGRCRHDSDCTDAIHCSQDEHLRFALWEVAVYMAHQSKAVETSIQLNKQDDLWFGAGTAALVLPISCLKMYSCKD